MNLIHSVQFEMDGKTIEQNTPFQGLIQSTRQYCSMSKDDLENFGSTLGLGSTLDNPSSQVYNASATYANNAGGNGLTNNRVYGNIAGVAGASVAQAVAGVSGVSNYGQQSFSGAQSSKTYNPALQDRMNNILAAGPTQSSSVTNALTNANTLNYENRNYSTVNNNYQIWYETAIIRLKDILGSFDSLCLLKRFSGTLKIYVNTGSFSVSANIAGDGSIQPYPVYNLSGQNTTFTNTCPLMLNALPDISYGQAVGSITCGLFISKAVTTSVASGGSISPANLGNSNAASVVQNCRIYYPLVKIKEAMLGRYIQENTAKTIVYTSFLQNLVPNITAGGNVSQLIQSGVRGIKTIFILPYLSASVYGASGQNQYAAGGGATIPFSPLLSPFDLAPMSTGPLSITNLNIQIGGQNVQQYLLSYAWQEFMQEVVEYNKINSGDTGISNGLFSSEFWKQQLRIYIVDCSRVENIENAVPRNIVIQYTNNTPVIVDYLIFTEYMDSFVVNVQTGLVTK
jgi:hypothetical protein